LSGREVMPRSGRLGARATVLPLLPVASVKRNRRSAARMTTTPPSTTTSHDTVRWSMLWSEVEIRTTPHLPRPCLLRLALLSPQVLSECLLVLVSCIHVPMPRPHADGLPHNVLCIVIESAAVGTLQPRLQDHRRVLHQDHRLVPTVLAPNGYCHGQGQHWAVPPLVYQINQHLDYLVGNVIRASSHWTASITVLLHLRRRRPPSPLLP
jgi:hypothetical protein